MQPAVLDRKQTSFASFLRTGDNMKSQTYASVFFKSVTLQCAVLLSVVAVVFSPCILAGYVDWDDYQVLVSTSLTAHFSAATIGSIFSSPVLGHYMPLTMLSFLLERTLFGLHPLVSHLINLLLHCANTMLVWSLARALLKDWRKAFFAALVFAVHPLHAESVSWVAERKDMLYALFYLSALTLYVNRTAASLRTRGCIMLLFALSLLSKAMAVSLPPLLLICDYLREGKITLRHVLEKIPLALAACVFAWLAILFQGSSGYVVHFSVAKITAGCILACGNLLFYIWQFFWPHAQSVFYPFPGSGIYGVPHAYYFAPPVLLVCAWLWLRQRDNISPLGHWGAAFFIITILPGLQIVPVGRAIAADHFTYIPYIGLILPLTDMAVGFYERMTGNSKKAAACFCAVWLLMLGVKAHARCAVWHDSITMWSDVIEQNPGLAIALNNRGIAYAKAGLYDNACVDYRKALLAAPGSRMIYNNLAVALAKKGDLHQAETTALKLTEISPDAASFMMLGDLRFMRGDRAGAVGAYTKALSADPGNARARANLALLCSTK
jgi:hypothetical protein